MGEGDYLSNQEALISKLGGSPHCYTFSLPQENHELQIPKSNRYCGGLNQNGPHRTKPLNKS